MEYPFNHILPDPPIVRVYEEDGEVYLDYTARVEDEGRNYVVSFPKINLRLIEVEDHGFVEFEPFVHFNDLPRRAAVVFEACAANDNHIFTVTQLAGPEVTINRHTDTTPFWEKSNDEQIDLEDFFE